MKSYRPGSGTAGISFDEYWCDHCARDAEYRNGGDDTDPAIGCKIIADALAFDITNPLYPKEWIYGDDGQPKCTAFTDDKSKPWRCDKTLDMFLKE